MSAKNAVRGRLIRHERVRKDMEGLPARPRLSVFRSNNHIYAQVIDDTGGRTLVAASSNEPALKGKSLDDAKGKTGKAAAVGQAIAKRAIEAGIKQVVFDRGGYKYHGRVKALAEAARKEGLGF
jgi:large subunit ribosomal protein L18